jgi:hypothetical protein
MSYVQINAIIKSTNSLLYATVTKATNELNMLASVARGIYFGPRDAEAQKTCAYL